MAIEQIKVGLDNFSYIICCTKTNNAAIVDPGYDASKVMQFITAQQLNLEYLILTHYHGDHTNDCPQIKKKYPSVKIITSEIDSNNLGFPVDIGVSDNDQINVGKLSLKFIVTPGHTPGSMCIIVDDMAIITGDTLFIGDCGRVDLTGGDLNQMYHSLHEKLMALPDDLMVYPGHDYGTKPYDSLGNQKANFSTYFKDVMHLIQKK